MSPQKTSNKSQVCKICSKVVLALSCLLCLSGVDSTAQMWSLPTKISNTGGTNPSMLVDRSGNLHAIWGSSEQYISYSRWDGQIWATPTNITLEKSSSNPGIAMDRSGSIHAVWTYKTKLGEADVFSVLYSQLGNAGWSKPVEVSGGAGSPTKPRTEVKPVIAVKTPGDIHVAWVDTGVDPVAFNYSQWTGLSWRIDRDSTLSGTSSIAMALDNVEEKPHVVFASGYIQYRRRDGTKWSTPTPISTAANSYNPAMTIDKSGNLHVVWIVVSGGRGKILYSRLDGDKWTEPDMAIDVLGNIHVVWSAYVRSDTGSSVDVFYSRWDSKNWSTPMNISNHIASSSKPKIATDPSGNPHVIWSNNVLGPEIFYSHRLASVDVISSDITPVEPLLTLKGHIGTVNSIAFSPKGDLLVSGGYWDPKGLRLWDLKTGKTIRIFPNPTPVYSVAFSPDGSRFISASLDQTVKLWDVTSGNLFWTHMDPAFQANSVDFSPDGNFIAVATQDSIVKILDASTGKQLKSFKGPESPTYYVEFSPSSKYLVSHHGAGKIAIWNVELGTQIKVLSVDKQRFPYPHFSPDGKSVAFVSDGKLKLWRVDADSESISLGDINEVGGVVAFRFNTDGNFITTFSNDGNFVTLWNVVTRNRTTLSLKRDASVFWHGAFAYNGQLVATGGKDEVIHIFDLSKYQDPTKTIPPSSSQPLTQKTMTRFSYSMQLSKGLNMISLPIKIDSPLTARKFSEMTGATFVVRFNQKTQKFGAWVPEVATSDGFEIEGGQGYVINALQEKTINFIGTGWGTPLPASPLLNPSIPTSSMWAFVIAGILSDDLVSKADKLIVRNLRNGMIAESYVENGRFAIPFVDMNRNNVVEDGNIFEIHIMDSTGNIYGILSYQVGIHDLIMGKLIVKPLISDLIPKITRLYQNYPNPFNPETWIPYQLSEAADVNIQIYDVIGRLIRTLSIGRQSPGIYISKDRAAYWDGRNNMGGPIASGIYYYKFQAEKFVAVRKMVIAK